jgi:hypothetical protein
LPDSRLTGGAVFYRRDTGYRAGALVRIAEVLVESQPDLARSLLVEAEPLCMSFGPEVHRTAMVRHLVGAVAELDAAEAVRVAYAMRDPWVLASLLPEVVTRQAERDPADAEYLARTGVEPEHRGRALAGIVGCWPSVTRPPSNALQARSPAPSNSALWAGDRECVRL